MFIKHIYTSYACFEEAMNEALAEIKAKPRQENEHEPVIFTIDYAIDNGSIHAFIRWDYVGWLCDKD